jgi:hypothetical protein
MAFAGNFAFAFAFVVFLLLTDLSFPTSVRSNNEVGPSDREQNNGIGPQFGARSFFDKPFYAGRRSRADFRFFRAVGIIFCP